MKKKVLEMSKPRVSVFPIYGHILSILPEKMTEPWIYNTFIQLRYLDVEHILFFDQYRSLVDGCPYINRNTIARKHIVSKYKNIVNYSEQMILENNYIFFHIDRYHIPFFDEYNKEHIWHELLIFGFSREEQIFYCADNGADGKYTHFFCTYEELAAAYSGISGLRFLMDVHTLELVKWWSDEDELIRMAQIFSLLEGYFCSKANVVFSEPFLLITYGIDAQYKVLEDVRESHDYIDIRAICLLLEHKVLMKERFQYISHMQEADVLTQGIKFYEELQKKYQVLRNMILKCNLNHNSSEEVKNISKRFEDAIKLEEEFRDNNFENIKKFFESYRKEK